MNTHRSFRTLLRVFDRGFVSFACLVLLLIVAIPAASKRLQDPNHFSHAQYKQTDVNRNPGKTLDAAETAHLARVQQNPSPTPNPTPTPALFKFEPTEVSRNTTHTLKITSSGDCATNKFEDKDKVISKADIDAFKSSGIEITPTNLELPDRCIYTATLTVTDAAAFKDISVNIHYKSGETPKTETIRITMVKEEALPPGPIPPGLKPEVDIMWGVVPQKVVKDNFGRRVGQNFYCIEVVIGNNSGYDLQIASVGFKLGPVGDAAKYVAKRIDQASAEIGGSPQVTDAINAQKDAAASSGDAAKKEALVEICKRMKQIKPNTKCENEEREATEARAQADGDTKIAQAKKEAAVAVIKERVELVKDEAAQLAELSRTAYTQVVPVGSYMMTRGSLEHGQIWSPRNFVLNGVKAFGPFLTGFLPYFHVLNHRTNYSEGINIISNPFEKGLEALMPDETIDQLQRLDEQILRDGVIIPNNRQIRTRVFVAKDSLRLGKTIEGVDMRDNPMMVTLALGEMVLIGNTIQYLNRVSVTSGPSGEVVPPPTVNPNSYKKDVAQGEVRAISLTGTNLKEAHFTSDDPTNLDIKDITTTNTSLSATLTVSDTARLGTHTLSVTNARSTVPVVITVTQPLPTFDDAKSQLPEMVPLAPTEKTYSATIKGGFLQGAELMPTGENNPLKARDVKVAPDGKSLTATIVAPAQTPAGVYVFIITNEQHTDVSNEELPKVSFKTKALPEVPKLDTPADHPSTQNAETDPKVVKYSRLAPRSFNVTLRGENLNNVNAVVPLNGSHSTFSDFTPSADGKQLTMKLKLAVEDQVDTTDLQRPALGDKAKVYKFRVKDTKGQPSAEDFAIEVKPQDVVSSISTSTAVVEMSTETIIVVNGQNLDGATLRPDSSNPAGWEITALGVPNENPTQMPVKIKALPAANFANSTVPVTLKFQVFNTNNSHEETVTVTVKFKAP